MTLFCEYAITHDVFDSASYLHVEVGTARFENLKDVLLQEAVLRNLRAGEWLSCFNNNNRAWHHRGMELLKKMAKQNRLRFAENVLQVTPANDIDWCREALASHEHSPLTGVISTAQVADTVGANPILGRIDRLGCSPFWTERGPSVRLARCHADYEKHLHLIMNCANSLMLIDPHLDPSQSRYRDVLPLLLLAQGRKPIPLIEIHRVIYVGSGQSRHFVDVSEWENRFRHEWGAGLAAAGLSVGVFIWDDYHDRYLISDLIGIKLSNGYDVSNNPRDITTWSRISRNDRDDIQREFDPACNRHILKHRFVVP